MASLKDRRQSSQYRLRNNDLHTFGLPKGSLVTVLHTREVPYGTLACVQYRGDPLIGLYCPTGCGCAYLRQSKKTLKLPGGTYQVVGVVVAD